MKTAVVAGSLVLDVTMVTDGGASPHELFRQGKQTYLDDVRFYLGGCVGNTGLALAKLGVPVRLVSKIGADGAGQMISGLLAREKADSRVRIDTERASACGIALTPPGMDKISFFRRGAAQFFRADDLRPEDLSGASLLHFGYPTAMPTMYANAGEELWRLLQVARAAGCVTSLDTSLPDLRSDAAQADWRQILAAVLPLTDIFMPSLEELLFMLDREKYKRLVEKNGSRDLIDAVNPSMVPTLAKACLELGARMVLLKAGKKGLYYKGAEDLTFLERLVDAEDQDYRAWAGRELWRPPLRVERIISATGAGDTAIAGFLAALLRGDAPESALCMATLTARRCISGADTVGNIRPLAEMDELLATRPETLPLSLDEAWIWDVENGVFVRK